MVVKSASAELEEIVQQKKEVWVGVVGVEVEAVVEEEGEVEEEAVELRKEEENTD